MFQLVDFIRKSTRPKSRSLKHVQKLSISSPQEPPEKEMAAKYPTRKDPKVSGVGVGLISGL